MIIPIISFLLGLVAGVLVSRKHRTKLEAAESKGRSLLAALKGKDE
jgi:hypothetical protein